MPKVTLLYFGSIRDITGLASEQTVAPATLEALHQELLLHYPSLQSAHYRYSVNETLITGDHQLADGDVIALLPPFAGG
ncbi:MAG: MoaD/ThiS family protein [Bacteroidales bacterium]|jgi:molybdopterin converting factor small subunit|nr:MoaD/ThiS family protein [Bacteroidales bacterium]NLO67949.1 MoaD/ThiS family protein [Bacteroidales bacterium]